ncbi:hypothetical protein N7472_005975 [Penicillium cf. griseofulvum]|uniref:Uncharacterized protein n=1 Tax=Penicillium cf. griseofulvum TaxID=2972120 RepID=A0A9W9MGB7_9EURO|nr:hypothetical protein N7472_005975 [Penicillium cf. griseofulvum]
MQRIKLEARQHLSAAVHVARRQALGHIPAVQTLRGKRTQIHWVSVVGVLIRLIWNMIGALDNLVRVVAHVLLVVGGEPGVERPSDAGHLCTGLLGGFRPLLQRDSHGGRGRAHGAGGRGRDGTAGGCGAVELAPGFGHTHGRADLRLSPAALLVLVVVAVAAIVGAPAPVWGAQETQVAEWHTWDADIRAPGFCNEANK